MSFGMSSGRSKRLVLRATLGVVWEVRLTETGLGGLMGPSPDEGEEEDGLLLPATGDGMSS